MSCPIAIYYVASFKIGAKYIHMSSSKYYDLKKILSKLDNKHSQNVAKVVGGMQGDMIATKILKKNILEEDI